MIQTKKLIDFDNLVLKSKEVFDDWEYYICENDGYYSEDTQSLIFDSNGIEILIDFTLSIRGSFWYEPSSYMEPEDGEVCITDVDVDIDNFYIGDDGVELTKELKKTLVSLVKKNIE
jgi:hypothetical protein